jgi:hypothetical protein
MKNVLSGLLSSRTFVSEKGAKKGHSTALGDRTRPAKLPPTAETGQKEILSGCQRRTKRHVLFLELAYLCDACSTILISVT